MCDKKYNGWPTYETWLVNLWMTNDEDSNAYYNEITNEEESIASLSHRLKDEIEIGTLIRVGETGLYSDLIGSALSNVRWEYIARHFWEDYRDDRAHDTAVSMIETYNQSRDDPLWLCHDNGDAYIRVYYDQKWIPDIFDDIVDEVESMSDLWIETGDDPTDIYICGNVEDDDEPADEED